MHYKNKFVGCLLEISLKLFVKLSNILVAADTVTSLVVFNNFVLQRSKLVLFWSSRFILAVGNNNKELWRHCSYACSRERPSPWDGKNSKKEGIYVSWMIWLLRNAYIIHFCWRLFIAYMMQNCSRTIMSKRRYWSW